MKNRSILPIFALLFLGYLGFSLILPLVPTLLMNPKYAILPKATTMQTRYILLGILFSAYPLGQFISCPLLGKLSDKYGRKPILVITLIGIIPAYILSGLSIKFSSFFLLFLSRITCGLMEGNVTIAQATMSDISTKKDEKTKRFGYIISIASTGFIFGPLLGGKLSNPEISPLFSLSTPFYAAALLSFFTLLISLFCFTESRTKDLSIRIHPKTIYQPLFRGIQGSSLKCFYLSNFYFYLACFFFFNFLSAFLIKKFHMNISYLATVNAYVAIPLALASLLFPILAKFVSEITSLLYSALLLALMLLLFILATRERYLLLTLFPLGLAIATGLTYCSLLISNNSSEEKQGVTLGINQAIQVLAELLTASLGGLLAGITIYLPFAGGIIFAIICAISLFFHLQTSLHKGKEKR